MDIDNYDLDIKNKSLFKTKKIIILLSFLFVFIFVFSFLFGAPINNNKKNIIHISLNENLNSISTNLKKNNLIKSEFLLKSFVSLFKSDKEIKEGDYLFYKNSPVFVVAWQLSLGKHNINPFKITLREGLTNSGMANILSNRLINFNKEEFLEKTKESEGYLFPDTYFFYPRDTVDEVILKLKNNFKNHLLKLKPVLNINKKSLSDSIIMASIIEKEAKGKNDAYIISGILWKRIKLGIPLQVDVDKSTYKKRGLPSKPISNPGFISIEAALNPAISPYLYYLHDKNGIVHFAKNFNEHKKNISRYLK